RAFRWTAHVEPMPSRRPAVGASVSPEPRAGRRRRAPRPSSTPALGSRHTLTSMTRAARQWPDGPASLVLLDPGTTGESGGEAGESRAGESRTVPLEVAASPRARTRGLLGRDGIEGALLLTPARSVHTFGMRFAIDVAHLDAELRVLSVCTMAPGRLG